VVPRPAQPYVGNREVMFIPPTQGPKG
jgi:hypothetical protein